VVEKVEDAVGAIDGGERTFDPGPLVGSVLGNAGVSVLEPGVQDKPGVRPDVGTEVPKADLKEAVVHADLDEEAEHENDASGGQKDFGLQLLGEHFGSRTVVVHDIPIIEEVAINVKAACRGQAQQIKRPTNEEVGVDLERSKGAVPHSVVQNGVEGFALVVRAETILLAGGRDVALSVNEVVGPAVVLGVGVLPGEVRDEQGLVHDEAPEVVEVLRRGEGSVPALVR